MADLPCELLYIYPATFGSTINTCDGYHTPLPQPTFGSTLPTLTGGFTSFQSGGPTPINYFKMAGMLVSTRTWVTWTVTNSPDPTGASYSSGPSSLIESSIHIKSRWTVTT